MDSTGSVTRYLKAWESGSPQAFNQLINLVYDQLSLKAHNMMRNERQGHTLQTRALVHETYIRLLELKEINWADKNHFYAMASSIMRRILVDHARGKVAKKRGGRAIQVTLENIADSESDLVDVIALNNALASLAANDSTQASIVELRYFGGLKISEIANILSLSPATVKRKWLLARAFLYREMSDTNDD